MPKLEEYAPGVRGLHGEASPRQRASAALASIRAANVDAQQAVAELTKQGDIARAATAAKKKAADDVAAAKQTAADDAVAKLAPTGGGGRGGFDVAKAVAAANAAKLEASGDREGADVAKAAEHRDSELERAKQASASGQLTPDEAKTAAAAVTSAYESEVSQIHARFAAVRQRADEEQQRATQRVQDADARKQEATAARVAEYQVQTQAATLRAMGRAWDAELVTFDAAWKRRIDNATMQDERLTAMVAYEAERREKIRQHEGEQGARANVGPTLDRGRMKGKERRDAETARAGRAELTRLNLRDSLGKTLTDDETTRRQRLRDRLGVGSLAGSLAGPVRLPNTPGPLANLDLCGQSRLRLPNLPNPLAAAMPLLRAAGGGLTVAPANVNVAAPVNVDAKKVGEAVVALVIPEIDRRMNQLRGQWRAQTHRELVAENL